MEAINTSERSASFYQTTQSNILEDSHIHCCENLKYYITNLVRAMAEFNVNST
jgi:hypothetical protein